MLELVWVDRAERGMFGGESLLVYFVVLGGDGKRVIVLILPTYQYLYVICRAINRDIPFHLL